MAPARRAVTPVGQLGEPRFQDPYPLAEHAHEPQAHLGVAARHLLEGYQAQQGRHRGHNAQPPRPLGETGQPHHGGRLGHGQCEPVPTGAGLVDCGAPGQHCDHPPRVLPGLHWHPLPGPKRSSEASLESARSSGGSGSKTSTDHGYLIAPGRTPF